MATPGVFLDCRFFPPEKGIAISNPVPVYDHGLKLGKLITRIFPEETSNTKLEIPVSCRSFLSRGGGLTQIDSKLVEHRDQYGILIFQMVKDNFDLTFRFDVYL